MGQTEHAKLTDKQRLFCLYYVRCFNATKAYQKAYGCNYATANSNGSKLLSNPGVKAEIGRLKQNRLNRSLLHADDIFQKYIDIALVDITDYMTFGQEEQLVMQVDPETGKKVPLNKMVNTVRLNKSDNVDGSLITEMSQSKDGVRVKLADKMRAMAWLADRMDLLDTATQRKLELEQCRLAGEDGEAGGGIVLVLADAVEEEAEDTGDA